MDYSVFLAKIVGPYCLVVAVGILLNRDFYGNIMDDFAKNPALLYLGGAMALLIGFLVVLTHNVWVLDWPVILTVFGWMGLIKGICLFVFPESMIKLMQAYRDKTALLTAHLTLVMIIGAALTAAGYVGG